MMMLSKEALCSRLTSQQGDHNSQAHTQEKRLTEYTRLKIHP